MLPGIGFWPCMLPMPAPDMPPIIAMQSCMVFMCSAISLLRSSGVLAFIIFSCMPCMVFIWASILAIWSGVAMLLAAAVPMGIAGAVLQAISVLAVARTMASGMNRKCVMANSLLGWVTLGTWGTAKQGGLDAQAALKDIGPSAN